MKLCNPSRIRCGFVLKQEERRKKEEREGRKCVKDYLREQLAGGD